MYMYISMIDGEFFFFNKIMSSGLIMIYAAQSPGLYFCCLYNKRSNESPDKIRISTKVPKYESINETKRDLFLQLNKVQQFSSLRAKLQKNNN